MKRVILVASGVMIGGLCAFGEFGCGTDEVTCPTGRTKVDLGAKCRSMVEQSCACSPRQVDYEENCTLVNEGKACLLSEAAGDQAGLEAACGEVLASPGGVCAYFAEDATPTSGSSSGSANYTVEGLKLVEDPTLHYIQVSGTILRNSQTGSGSQATVSFYSDDYATLIDSTKETIGDGISRTGGSEPFEISSFKVFAFPATDGLFKVCATFVAENSNYKTPAKLGCFDPQYTISEVKLATGSLRYAEVTGVITRDSDHGSAAQAIVRYFSDDYITLIDSVERKIGEGISDTVSRQSFEISSLSVYLLPSSGGFSRVCADLTVRKSNYETPTRLGCLTGTN